VIGRLQTTAEEICVQTEIQHDRCHQRIPHAIPIQMKMGPQNQVSTTQRRYLRVSMVKCGLTLVQIKAQSIPISLNITITGQNTVHVLTS